MSSISRKAIRSNAIQRMARGFSTKTDIDFTQYPLNKSNTVINFCDQGEQHVIQRFGKYNRTVNGGLYLTIPFIDSIIVQDMRELCLPIEPQTGVTKDNVYTSLSGILFVQVENSYDATYNIRRPLLSVMKSAEAAMRDALGDMELDECFREKDKLNKAVLSHLEGITKPWGLVPKRYEITDIDASHEIKQSMNKQASAERERREAELGADAEAAVIKKLALAQKQKDIDESLGIRTRLENEAAGEAAAIKLKADADRYRVEQDAKAIANMTQKIMEASGVDGVTALGYQVATEYIDAFHETGKESNTLFMNADASDVPAMVAKGMASLSSMKNFKNE
jgi:regulator of protease activity HflC (stomatin/prohibitin superfamily)